MSEIVEREDSYHNRTFTLMIVCALSAFADSIACSFQLCATLGTTGACAFDNMKELGPICKFTFRDVSLKKYSNNCVVIALCHIEMR